MDDAAIRLYERAGEVGLAQIFEEARQESVTPSDILSTKELDATRFDRFSVIPWRSIAAEYRLIKHARAVERFLPN